MKNETQTGFGIKGNSGRLLGGETRNPSRWLPPAAAAMLAALAPANSAQAQTVGPDPTVPPKYPDGVYRTAEEIDARFSGAGLAMVLTKIEHRPLLPTNPPVGADEIENFNSPLVGQVPVNGGPLSPVNASGPVQTKVFGKVGNVTGTFQTEVLSMSLAGGGIRVRESPTLASTGQTTITSLGGGLYRLESYFNVFAEVIKC